MALPSRVGGLTARATTIATFFGEGSMSTLLWVCMFLYIFHPVRHPQLESMKVLSGVDILAPGSVGMWTDSENASHFWPQHSDWCGNMSTRSSSEADGRSYGALGWAFDSEAALRADSRRFFRRMITGDEALFHRFIADSMRNGSSSPVSRNQTDGNGGSNVSFAIQGYSHGATTDHREAAPRASGSAHVFLKSFLVNSADNTSKSDHGEHIAESVRPVVLIDGFVWLREGSFVNNNLVQYRVFGGAVSNDESPTLLPHSGVRHDGADRVRDGSTFFVLALPQGVITSSAKSQLMQLVSDDESMVKLVDHLSNREGIPAKDVARLVHHIMRRHTHQHGLNGTNGCDILIGEAERGRAPSDASGSALRTCPWVGMMHTSLEWKSDDAVAVATTSGSWHALCPFSSLQTTENSHHISFFATNVAYEAELSAWNFIMAIFMVVAPGATGVVGTVSQWQWMRFSRTRLLRVSRVQLMFIFGVQSLYVFLCQIAWSVFPQMQRMINVGYVISLFHLLSSLHTFSTIDREVLAMQQRPPRGPIVVVLLISSISLSSLIPAIFRTQLFQSHVVVLGCALFWVPQLVDSALNSRAHFSSGEGRSSRQQSHNMHAFTPWNVAATSLFPICIVATLLLAPFPVFRDAINPHEHPFMLWCALVLVVSEAVLLVTLPYILSPAVTQRLFFWRYRYRVTADQLQRPPLSLCVAEDPECSICGEAIAVAVASLPVSAVNHASTANAAATSGASLEVQEIWITPCQHLFHAACLQQWMEERMACPLCRKILPEP